MNTLVQDYINAMDADFGEDWIEYLPVYFHEQREIVKSWGYDVRGLSDEKVGMMFENILTEALVGEVAIKSVTLDSMPSTCEVMEWILMHGCPQLSFTHFNFKKGVMNKCMVVSSIPKQEILVEKPVEEWHEPIPGIRRFAALNWMWYCEISGRYYYITG